MNKEAQVLSDKYRLMIYFAHSTLVMYSKDIAIHKTMSVQEFKEVNKAVCLRVHEEALNIFNYELSNQQMSTAVQVYMNSYYYPQSVKDTKAYQLKQTI